MKNLILILTLFTALSIQAQISYNPARKLVYVRTLATAHKKPPISQLQNGEWGLCLGDSTLWRAINNEVVAFGRMYTYSGTKKIVQSNPEDALTANFSGTKKMYYILYDSISGNLPILADFPTGIYQAINTMDSIWYDKYRGLVRAAKIFYLFTPTHPDVITPIFFNGWESGIVTSGTYNNWQEIERVYADRFSVVSTLPKSGSKCARVEVRHSDNPIAPTSPGTSRAEVYAPQGENNLTIPINESSGTIQYKFSVKLDTSWANLTTSDFAIFFQIKAPAGVSTNPMLTFSATDSIDVKFKAGNDLTATRVTYNAGTLDKGNWIDFKVTIKYSKTLGSLKIERNGVTIVNLNNIPTLLYNPNINGGVIGTHYIKTGLYRTDKNFTSILYLDDFTISTVN